MNPIDATVSSITRGRAAAHWIKEPTGIWKFLARSKSIKQVSHIWSEWNLDKGLKAGLSASCRT
jgi:hypothetical protein